MGLLLTAYGTGEPAAEITEPPEMTQEPSGSAFEAKATPVADNHWSDERLAALEGPRPVHAAIVRPDPKPASQPAPAAKPTPKPAARTAARPGPKADAEAGARTPARTQ